MADHTANSIFSVQQLKDLTKVGLVERNVVLCLNSTSKERGGLGGYGY